MGLSVMKKYDVCIFFCFKQKTAYEMRISDWSSDVCSSDLPANFTTGGLISLRLFLGWRLHNMLSIIAFIGGAAIGGFAEIGRASCRESVCQYVLITVVDVYLKKNNIIKILFISSLIQYNKTLLTHI